MNRMILLILGSLLLVLGGGCTKKVEAGHVGMCRTSDGFNGEVLDPGYHGCWGTRTEMYQMEVAEQHVDVPMQVLCTDNLNFGFTVGVLVAVNRENTELIKYSFENMKPEGKVGDDQAVTSEQLVKRYVLPVVDQEARKVVSKYETTAIVKKRGQIIEEVKQAVMGAMDNSLVVVKRVTVNSLDFPEVITKAQERMAERRVEIETERAEQEKRLVQERNKLKIAEIQYRKELVEAAMIADANRIIGTSITPAYLAWWQLKVFGEAASGPNNWGFIPYTDFANGQGKEGMLDPEKWTTPKGAIDAELLKRINEAREAAKQEEDAVLPPVQLPQEAPPSDER